MSGCSVEFACTDPTIGERAAVGLFGGKGFEERIRLCFVEADALDWPPPPKLEARESERLQRWLADQGVSAVIPPPDAPEREVWTLFDRRARIGLVVVRSLADLPPWMAGAPFTVALHLAFAARGARLVHAASLGLEQRGVLLAGPGGAGKSATTIAGVLRGLSTTGDDYLLLEALASQQGLSAAAYPVYRYVKQAPAGLSRFPSLSAATAGLPLNWQGKVEFDIDLIRKDAMAEKLQIEAILIPTRERRAGTSLTTPATPSEAFSALARSTLSQLPGEGLAGFALLTRLTRGLPAFHLHLSDNPADIGDCIRRLLMRS